MGTTEVFAASAILASPPSAFLRLARLIFTLLLTVVKSCSAPSLQPGVEKGVLPSAFLMHPCVLAGIVGLGHGVYPWCGKTP